MSRVKFYPNEFLAAFKKYEDKTKVVRPCPVNIKKSGAGKNVYYVPLEIKIIRNDKEMWIRPQMIIRKVELSGGPKPAKTSPNLKQNQKTRQSPNSVGLCFKEDGSYVAKGEVQEFGAALGAIYVTFRDVIVPNLRTQNFFTDLGNTKIHSKYMTEIKDEDNKVIETLNVPNVYVNIKYITDKNINKDICKADIRDLRFRNKSLEIPFDHAMVGRTKTEPGEPLTMNNIHEYLTSGSILTGLINLDLFTVSTFGWAIAPEIRSELLVNPKKKQYNSMVGVFDKDDWDDLAADDEFDEEEVPTNPTTSTPPVTISGGDVAAQIAAMT